MADDPLDALDYYTLIGVAPNASTDVIKTAFRAFALRYHPDRHVAAGTEAMERATAIYRRGSEALQVLTSPTERHAYDKGLAKGIVRFTDPKPIPSARPPSPAKPGTELTSPGAKAFYARALQASKAGDYPLALRMIEGALEQEPRHPLLLTARKRLLGQS